MRVLVTGHRGYIGSVLVPLLAERGHEVHGLDSYLFAGCTLGPDVPDVPALAMDVRDVSEEHLAGFDAVCHLAAISNDPVGDLRAETTYEVNHRAAVALAVAAKRAGVARFLFSSSCSLYGAAADDLLDESAAFNPVTPYGRSKVLAEAEIAPLADERFAPTFLRNGTVYGMSPRLRADLVVNNLVGFAVTTGEVLLKSDGTPWRPLVHVEDVAAAFAAVLEADLAAVRGAAFNIGRTKENYRIRDVAAIVEEVVPGSRVVLASGAGPDIRNYRVSCELIARVLPAFRPRWTVRRGVEELYRAYVEHGLTTEAFTGPRLMRLRRVRELQEEGLLDERLRWVEAGDRARSAV